MSSWRDDPAFAPQAAAGAAVAAPERVDSHREFRRGLGVWAQQREAAGVLARLREWEQLGDDWLQKNRAGLVDELRAAGFNLAGEPVLEGEELAAAALEILPHRVPEGAERAALLELRGGP